MLILFYIFLFFCFLKGFYYGLFEIKNKNNKKSGVLVIILSFIGFILPAISIYISY